MTVVMAAVAAATATNTTIDGGPSSGPAAVGFVALDSDDINAVEVTG